MTEYQFIDIFLALGAALRFVGMAMAALGI